MPKSWQVRPLEERWADYYRPGFKAEGFTDALRQRLLTTDGVELDKPFAGKPAGAVRKQSTAVLTNLRKLGYVLERDAHRLRVVNRDHRPTPADFAADRARTSAYNAKSKAHRNGNGSAAVEVMPRATGKRRALREIGAMLPPLGDELTVTVVGVGPTGTLVLVLVNANGWRYSCSVEQAEAPTAGQS